ncbi:uncharacterized protein PHACADRAFT_189652 [Phanerochaete carnosa HHB-10118-sp]|uniref:Uncharacterized protein n=1 Tax=Phanerochaete carnosa (strain HHB-10118-sp) TaxID=650164 RepID=K5XC08_PHACS|nr:uncharacterized protein PHACADRAFT_189652 [Phanerochaete carnosa HHB-10118-sp]EKM60522.1 hypothetical protein PHACADRAFT_189652 [Phanerochaete carnosa HHB-10118-sp]
MAPQRQWPRVEFVDHPRLCERAPDAYAKGKPKVWCKKCLAKALRECGLSDDAAFKLWDNAEICRKLKEDHRGWLVCRTWTCLTHLRDCKSAQPNETRKRATQELDELNAARRRKNELSRRSKPRLTRRLKHRLTPPSTPRLTPLPTPRLTRSSDPRIWSPLPLPPSPYLASFTEPAPGLAVVIAGATPGQARGDELWQETVALQSPSSIVPLVPDISAAPPFAPIAPQFPVPSLPTFTAFFESHVTNANSDHYGDVPLIDGGSFAGMHGSEMQQAALQPAFAPCMAPEFPRPMLANQHNMFWKSGGYVAPDSEATYTGTASNHIMYLPDQYSIPPQPPPTYSQQPIGGDSSSFCGPCIPTEDRVRYYTPAASMLPSARRPVGQDDNAEGAVHHSSWFWYHVEPSTVGQRYSLAPEPLRPPFWPPW